MPTNANKDNKNRKHTGDICAIHIYKCCAAFEENAVQTLSDKK